MKEKDLFITETDNCEITINHPNIQLSQDELCQLLGSSEMIEFPNTRSVVFDVLTEEQIIQWSKTEAMTFALYFTAPWCGPCKLYSTIFTQVAFDYTETQCLFGRTDVDQAEELAQKIGIVALPTTIIVRDGIVMASAVGILEPNELKAMINKYRIN